MTSVNHKATPRKNKASTKNDKSRQFISPNMEIVEPAVYMARVRAMPHPKVIPMVGVKQSKNNKTIAALNRKTSYERNLFLRLMLSALTTNEENKRKRSRDKQKDD